MIKRSSLIAALAPVIVLLLVASTSCSKKAVDAGWKADISVVYGVKTIRNPETPCYGTFAFDLAEDLVIGQEKDQAYFFPQFANINVDGQGRIYVCDIGNNRVQVFDNKGVYVRTLGRKGQGPGEYDFPQAVFLDDHGDVCIRSSWSLVIYGADGIFKKNIKMKTFLSYFILGPGGTVIGQTQPSAREEGGPKNKIVQLGPDGEMLRTVASYPVYGASGGLVLNHWYGGRLAFCLRPDQTFFYGFSLDYKIHVADGEGRELFAFSKAENEQEITAQEADLTRKSGISAWYGSGDPKTAPLNLPDHRPFFSRFYSDDLGRLYVIRFRPIMEKAVKTPVVEVFSKDGYYLYQMTWPFYPEIIKGGFFYEVRQDEEAALTKVIRHRIRNWGDFRAE